jgi:hypothetical protein
VNDNSFTVRRPTYSTANAFNVYQFLVSCYFRVDGIPAVLHCQLMARKVRVQYPGAIYHFMNRGDHREPNFRSDKDRELFLKSLTKQGSS